MKAGVQTLALWTHKDRTLPVYCVGTLIIALFERSTSHAEVLEKSQTTACIPLLGRPTGDSQHPFFYVLVLKSSLAPLQLLQAGSWPADKKRPDGYSKP